MAPVAMIFGGICGTLAAMLGWLVLGMGFWAAVQAYFIVGLVVAASLIVLSLLGPHSSDDKPSKVSAALRA